MTIIDSHIHIIVPEILRDAAPQESWRPRVFWENDSQIVEFARKQIKSAVREFVDLDRILAENERVGVDHVLLCPWVSLLRYDAPSEEGLQICTIYNEALSRMAQSHPEKVSALGMVPLQDPELAAKELDSLMRQPGIFGVEIAASVNGVYLGDDRFDPFWAAAERMGALVFIHPTTRGFDSPVFNEYYLWNAVGNPVETTVTAAHMVLSGVMQKYPRLKVLLAHGGGTILSLRGRLRHAASFQPQARARLTESVDDSLRRFYYDTVTHDADLLQELVEYVGAEHVLLGSDYPFDMGVEYPARIIEELDLGDADKTLILGGNAERLMKKER